MSSHLIDYSVTDAALSEMRTRLLPSNYDCKTPAGYKGCQAAIAEVRDIRVAVEKKRVELKEDSIKWGRAVDAEAKRITAALLAIEEPLKSAKSAIDDEKARIKREAEEAQRRAEEECLRKQREAEQQRLREEAERLRLEREELDRQRKEEEAKQRAERERIDAERRAEMERQRHEREAHEAAMRRERAEADAEAARQAAIAAAERRRVQEEQEAERRKLEAERAAIEAEKRKQREEVERIERERIEAEQEAERLARYEASRPSREKALAYIAAIESVPVPQIDDDDTREELEGLRAIITRACNEYAKLWSTIMEGSQV